MSKTITIPTCMNPYVVIVNHKEYAFKAGETVEVPDEVAEVIEAHTEVQHKEVPQASGSSNSSVGKNFELIGTIDFSTEAMARGGAFVEYAVEDVSEIIAVWTDMVNTSTSKSTVNLNANGELVNGISIARTGSSGTPLNGYTKVVVYDGVGAMVNISQGAISATNYSTATDDSPFNLFPITEKITKIRVINPPTQYYAVGGILKIYAR